MQGHHLSRGQRSVCRQSDPSSRVNRDEARTRRPSDVKLSNLHLTPWASGFESGRIGEAEIAFYNLQK